MAKRTALHIGTSPITNTIFAGTINARGNCWVSKQDVTMKAIGAVCEHVAERMRRDDAECIVITRGGVPVYEIIVREISGEVAP